MGRATSYRLATAEDHRAARQADIERRRRQQRRADIGFNICIVGLFISGFAELAIAIVRIAEGR